MHNQKLRFTFKQNVIMIKYPELKLIPSDYQALKPDSALKAIVFQFFLEKQDDILPKLRAYSMKQNHKVLDPIIYRNLQYLVPNPTAKLSILGLQIMGDLQVSIQDLDDLIKNSNPDPHAYEYLLFTPKLGTAFGEKNHIIFEITVVPAVRLAAISAFANPSPPKNSI